MDRHSHQMIQNHLRGHDYDLELDVYEPSYAELLLAINLEINLDYSLFVIF